MAALDEVDELPFLFIFYFFIFYVLVGLTSGEGDELLFFFFIFNWATSGSLSMSACIDFLCQLNAYRWVPPIRFGVNLLSIRDQCELETIPESHDFLRLKRKVQNLAFNIVVLC
jgi:hypothetical protein